MVTVYSLAAALMLCYCLFLVISVTNGKHILRETTTFSDAEPSSSLTRGKRPKERINISFPGKLFFLYFSIKNL